MNLEDRPSAWVEFFFVGPTLGLGGVFLKPSPSPIATTLLSSSSSLSVRPLSKWLSGLTISLHGGETLQPCPDSPASGYRGLISDESRAAGFRPTHLPSTSRLTCLSLGPSELKSPPARARTTPGLSLSRLIVRPRLSKWAYLWSNNGGTRT